VCEMHEDFWNRVEPIVDEMKRLRMRHAPSHARWLLKNYEEAITHIQKRIFRTARREKAGTEQSGRRLPEHTTRAAHPAPIPLSYENDKMQKRAA
jgi:hypothetical protein